MVLRNGEAQSCDGEPGCELNENISIGRVIKEGDPPHLYSFAVKANQFVHALVEQNETDLVIEVFDPSGQKASEFDARTRGPEFVCFVADQTGQYSLRIRLRQGATSAGPYTVTLKELGKASPEALLRVSAEEACNDAKRLAATGQAENRRAALLCLTEAVSHWKTLGEKFAYATSLIDMGNIHFALSDFKATQASFGLALPVTRHLKDRRAEAEILNNIAMGHWQLGEITEALRCLEDALPIWRELGHTYGEAAALSNIGILHRHLGEWQAALERYFNALGLIRSLKDERGEGYTCNNIAMVYNHVGEYVRALSYLERARTLFHTAGDRIAEGRSLLRIGQVHLRLNNSQGAYDDAHQALALIRTAGDKRSEADALKHLGDFYDTSGDARLALEHYKQALSLYRLVGARYAEAGTLHSIGRIVGQQGETENALALLREALGSRRAVGDRDGEAATHAEIALLYRDSGRLEEARHHIANAVAQVEELRSGVAGAHLRTSYSATKQQYYRLYIDILMQLYDRQPTEALSAAALEISERSRARSLIEVLGDSRHRVRKGSDRVLLQREELIQRRLNFYSQQLEQSIEAGDAERQRSARRALEGALEEYDILDVEIRTATPHFADLVRPQPVNLAEIRQLGLGEDTLFLHYCLSSPRSYLWALTGDALHSTELPSRAVIEKEARTVYGVMSSRNGLSQTADSRPHDAAINLSEFLLAPVADALPGRRLVIIADGFLQYIPFAALPAPESQAPLCVEHDIVNLPSASTLVFLRRQLAARAPASKLLAVIADPVFDLDDARVHRRGEESVIETSVPRPERAAADDCGLIGRPAQDRGCLSRLPFSAREANAILRLVPHGDSLRAIGFKASKGFVKSAEIGQYRIVHFATHAILNDDHPELSAVALSMVHESGRLEDGFFRLHEIYNLDLNADLVVLSACQTGLGKEISGEGLVGLTSGFFYAGARRLVVSLWKVDDQATAELMTLFYQEMLGRGELRPASALRAAQVKMMRQKRWRNPYYWAGFILQGDWH